MTAVCLGGAADATVILCVHLVYTVCMHDMHLLFFAEREEGMFFPARSFREFFLKMYSQSGQFPNPHPTFPPDLFLYLNLAYLKKIIAVIKDAHIKVFAVKKNTITVVTSCS
jgi:hypothetical protein